MIIILITPEGTLEISDSSLGFALLGIVIAVFTARKGYAKFKFKRKHYRQMTEALRLEAEDCIGLLGYYRDYNHHGEALPKSTKESQK